MALTDIHIIGYNETIYLINSTGSPVSAGDPTGASTTPFSIGDDGWTVHAAQAQAIYGGGPPFRDGTSVTMRRYPPVVETISMLIQASGADNASALLRRIYNAANSALFADPSLLYVQAAGATSGAVAEIYDAQVVEDAADLNPTGGFTSLHFSLTITRSPFFTAPGAGSLTTLANGATLPNAYNGAGLPYLALTAVTTGLMYDGQPLYLTLSSGDLTSASTGVRTVYLAGCNTVQQDTVSYSLVTSSTTGIGDTITSVAGAFPVLASWRLRLLAVITGASSNLQIQISLHTTNSVGSALLWQSAWIAPGTGSPTIVDLGAYIPDETWRDLMNWTASNITVSYNARSTTGGATTGTLTRIDQLLYYHFCKLVTNSGAWSGGAFRVTSVAQQSIVASYARLLPAPVAIAFSGGQVADIITLTGSVPMAMNNIATKLYCAVMLNGVYTQASSMLVTVGCAVLYRSIRGNE